VDPDCIELQKRFSRQRRYKHGKVVRFSPVPMTSFLSRLMAAFSSQFISGETGNSEVAKAALSNVRQPNWR
jgi:hypothetical protein